jgi:hydrogenase nickel incorporation protein HypB
MCIECGCGKPGPYHVDGEPAGATSGHNHPHSHEHTHAHRHADGTEHSHPHAHEHEHDHVHGTGQAGPHDHSHSALHEDGEAHEHAHGSATDPGHRSVDVNAAILSHNDRQAERNRGFFLAHHVLVLNVLSSPGAGKTTLIQKTIERLQPQIPCGVIVGDLATDNDARRLRATGAPVVQVNTGTICHLDAGMVSRALENLDLAAIKLLVIENVGNLVCPAAFDLGEQMRVVLLSVTEGEDKPLKYPPIFHAAHAAVVTKQDLASVTDFDRSAAMANLQSIAHHARIFEVSARTGQGMEAWCAFLAEAQATRAAH